MAITGGDTVGGGLIPGEFLIEICKINLPNGKTIDLLSLKENSYIVELNISESINSNAITGDLKFIDVQNIAQRGPIFGQETLELKIRTTQGFDNESASIDFTQNPLIITSLKAYDMDHDAIAVTTVNFCTQEIVQSSRIRLSQSFNDTHSAIVSKIMKDIVKSGKKLFLEDSIGRKRVVAPNLTPFDFIKSLTPEAVNESKEPTYYFFETTQGYHFRTLESMYSSSRGAKILFHYFEADLPGGKHNPNRGFDWVERLGTILNHQILPRFDTSIGLYNGVFASKLIEHDIFKKSYKMYEYDYFEDDAQITPASAKGGGIGDPLFSENSINAEGKSIVSDKEKTFVLATSTTDGINDAHYSNRSSGANMPVNNFIAKNGKSWFQKRRSMMHLMASGNSAPSVQLTVHGNTLVNAGDMIELTLTERHREPESKGADNDPLYTGAFIIKSIKHTFELANNRHSMGLIVQRNSTAQKAPSNGKTPSKGSFEEVKEIYGEAF